MISFDVWTLLSPEPDARVDAARWAHQARTFFRLELAVVQDKRYPAGTLPIADGLEINVSGGAERTRAVVVTVPADRAPLVVAAVLASIFLAPIVPPGGGTIFGVKGARERLAAAGLRT